MKAKFKAVGRRFTAFNGTKTLEVDAPETRSWLRAGQIVAVKPKKVEKK